MSEFHAVIPARFASTRLPGKPLADIHGKPMVVRVAERAQASGALGVYVASDHGGVASAVSQHGFQVVMTSPDCASGTDRLAEVASKLGWADDVVVVNVQGDEPLIDPAMIDLAIQPFLEESGLQMGTLKTRIKCLHDFLSPNVVKVVTDKAGFALYFSRAPIPWARDAWADSSDPAALPEDLSIQRHIGLYAYRVGFLKAYPGLSRPAIELHESLEQLRALWHGYRIVVIESAEAIAPGVDTQADLEKVRALMA